MIGEDRVRAKDAPVKDVAGRGGADVRNGTHDDHGRALRLAYITGTYPLVTTTFIDREVRALRRRGAKVEIVAARRPSADAPLSAEQRQLQGSVRYLLPVRPLELLAAHLWFATLRPWRFFRTLAWLLVRPHPSLRARAKTLLHFGEGVYAASLLRTSTARELHAHFADRAATIALVAGRLLDMPYSLSIHAAADIFVAPVLLREKVANARHVVACTSYLTGYVLELVGRDLSGKVSTVRHGLDLAELPPPVRVPDATTLILAVGQLKERKGFVQLIRACGALRDLGYRFRCRIVGDGPQREELEALIHRWSLEDVVTLCGALRHDRVIEQYRSATMFILPCIRTGEGDVDGIPNVLAEAMALAVPVISTTLPAIEELVSDGEDGLLIQPGDDAELVAAMRRLLDEPELRRALGAGGRRTVVETFDVESNVQRFASMLWPDRFAEDGEVSTG